MCGVAVLLWEPRLRRIGEFVREGLERAAERGRLRGSSGRVPARWRDLQEVPGYALCLLLEELPTRG